MILVIVGNAHQGFLRLLNAVDALAGEGFFSGERVFIQSGNNPQFQPKFCEHQAFVGMDEFTKRVLEADLVICHSGAGVLTHVLRSGRVPVVMPRRQEYDEVIDDHQLELVEVLAAQSRIIPAYEPEDLRSAIERARDLPRFSAHVTESKVFTRIGEAIESLLAKKR